MAAALAVVLAWTFFAFGGVYSWSLVPAIGALALVAVVQRPAIGAEWRALDTALGLVLVAAALQLVPLPASLRLALSPASADFQQRMAIAPPPTAPPLSLVPGSWLWGIGTTVAAAACFWIARQPAQWRGARFLARSIAWMGLFSGLLVIVEPALFPNGKMYGVCSRSRRWRIRPVPS